MADSPFMKHTYTTRCERTSCIEECRTCEYLSRCGGGCYTIALAHSLVDGLGRGFDAPDKWKCAFFKGNYEEKVREVLMTDAN